MIHYEHSGTELKTPGRRNNKQPETVIAKDVPDVTTVPPGHML
jgi:hypothetical protein